MAYRRRRRRVFRMSELSPDYFSKPVSEVDPEIAQVLDDERDRQEATLEMIASENFVPQAVLDAQGSVLTNKYAEGYPGRRYYGGCAFVGRGPGAPRPRAGGGFWGPAPHRRPPPGAPGHKQGLLPLLP